MLKLNIASDYTFLCFMSQRKKDASANWACVAVRNSLIYIFHRLRAHRHRIVIRYISGGAAVTDKL